MTAALRKTVSIWCPQCQAYVEYEGKVYDTRKDAPTHVTPDLLRAHRAAAGHS